METFVENILKGVRQWVNTKFDEVTLAEPVSDEIIKMLWDGDIKMSDLKQTTGSSDFVPVGSQTNLEHFIDIFYPNPEEIFVDLGLSVKWRAVNLGAHNITDYGNYYAWGETETKSDYSWGTYKHANGAYNKLTKYCPTNKTDFWNGTGSPDNKLILDAVDDITTQTYGSNYRMPTKAEIEELKALPNEWVTDYNGISGLNGRVFTGKNSNTLFIPAAGCFFGSTHEYAGTSCYLWSNSLDSDGPGNAWRLYFNSDKVDLLNGGRCYGLSVRCVSTDHHI